MCGYKLKLTWEKWKWILSFYGSTFRAARETNCYMYWKELCCNLSVTWHFAYRLIDSLCTIRSATYPCDTMCIVGSHIFRDLRYLNFHFFYKKRRWCGSLYAIWLKCYGNQRLLKNLIYMYISGFKPPPLYQLNLGDVAPFKSSNQVIWQFDDSNQHEKHEKCLVTHQWLVHNCHTKKSKLNLLTSFSHELID